MLSLRSETTFEYRFELWLLVANPAIVDSFLLIDNRVGIGEGQKGKGGTQQRAVDDGDDAPAAVAAAAAALG